MALVFSKEFLDVIASIGCIKEKIDYNSNIENFLVEINGEI